MTGTILTVPGAGGDGIGFNSGNDGTLTIAVGPTGAKVNALYISAAGVVQQSQAQSMVRLNTANGYGSSNTCIRRFTNTVTNQGSDITYADSATLGGSFTINTAGVYAITYTANPSTGNAFSGVSLNTTQPTVSIASLANTSERLTIGQAYLGGANFTSNWTGYLAAGSVIRAHDDAGGASGSANYLFTIVRIA